MGESGKALAKNLQFSFFSDKVFLKELIFLKSRRRR